MWKTTVLHCVQSFCKHCSETFELLVNNLISKNQLGFMKCHSTTHQLLHALDAWTNAYDKSSVDSNLMNFTKAFDMATHNHLLAKLQLHRLCNPFIG